MTTITVNSNYGLDIRLLDFSSIYYGAAYTYGATIFRAYYSNSSVDEFRGAGFTYSNGVPTGGTVTSYAAFYNGQRLFTVDGASISVKSIVKAASTYSTTDDLAVIASALTGNDIFKGGNGSDVLSLYGGNDLLYGNGGSDALIGGTGNDKLNGGLGRDFLYGETGADTFVYASVKDSTVSTTGRDTIFDFVPSSGDKIDLSRIDANTKVAGNQAFAFIGTAAFHGKAGELRYEKKAPDLHLCRRQWRQESGFRHSPR